MIVKFDQRRRLCQIIQKRTAFFPSISFNLIAFQEIIIGKMTTWVALESNPEVLSKYIHKLGVSPLWSLTDVFGLEPDQLEWMPKPVKAVILLFPDSDDKHSKNETDPDNSPVIPKDIFFMKQFINNACGAIALVHGIANNPDIEIEDGSVLKKYLDAARGLTADERGKLLENDTSFTDAHQLLGVDGQTNANNEEVIHHFVVFVNFNNELYELDGRKSGPISHGASSPDTLLEDAAKVCKKYMARDPDDVRFSVIALVPTQE